MISAHKGMNITEAEYEAVTEDILSTRENRIDNATARDVTAILTSLRNQVMGFKSVAARRCRRASPEPFSYVSLAFFL